MNGTNKMKQKNRQKSKHNKGNNSWVESENRMRVAETESGAEMGRDREHKDQMRGTQTDEDGMGWAKRCRWSTRGHVRVCDSDVCQTVIAASQHPSTASEQSEVFSKAKIQTGVGEEEERVEGRGASVG